MRNPNFDFLKGILILLVITGHILPGTLTDSFPRFLIYSFHMPLFIAIAGYFFGNMDSKNVSFVQLFKKYEFRGIYPWLIALVAYSLYQDWGALFVENKYAVLWDSFRKPYYHLWFVPGLLGYVFSTLGASKVKLPVNVLLVVSVLLSAFFMVLREHRILFVVYPDIKEYVEVLLYTFRPQYFMFFVLGIWARRAHIQKLEPFVPYLSIVGLSALLVSFFLHQTDVYIFAFYFFNFFFAIWMLKLSEKRFFPNVKILQWIGVNSLGIYLWHQFPLMILKEQIADNQNLLLYTVLSLSAVLIIGFIYWIGKSKWINKTLFGIIEK